MTNRQGIYIKNIYYMLSYAFQVLKQTDIEEVAAEEFKQVQDLFAAILAKGIARQIKQGLYREYREQKEDLTVMRGKLDLPKTFKHRVQRKQKLACVFDELTEDNIYNQILKTTIYYLLRDPGVDSRQKKALQKLGLFFDGVSLLNPLVIPWKRLYYQKGNKNYEMLLNLCFFVLEGMLQTTEDGNYKMAAFSDEHMARLYERFILEYYRQHHGYLSEIKSARITWNLTGKHDPAALSFLPAMQSDIFLRLGEKILIIDAKYYGKTLQNYFDKQTLHSANLYQIFAYVKNQDKKHSGKVAGLLLYAKTDEAITPDCAFTIDGNKIGAKTLDLSADFRVIRAQLDGIVKEYFGV